MPKIPTRNTSKDWQMLNDEYEARKENEQFNLLRSIRNRTMTRVGYYKTMHRIRRFCWGLKQNKFLCS